MFAFFGAATVPHNMHRATRGNTRAVQQRGLNRAAAALPQSSGCGCGVARDAVRQTVRRRRAVPPALCSRAFPCTLTVRRAPEPCGREAASLRRDLFILKSVQPCDTSHSTPSPTHLPTGDHLTASLADVVPIVLPQAHFPRTTYSFPNRCPNCT